MTWWTVQWTAPSHVTTDQQWLKGPWRKDKHTVTFTFSVRCSCSIRVIRCWLFCHREIAAGQASVFVFAGMENVQVNSSIGKMSMSSARLLRHPVGVLPYTEFLSTKQDGNEAVAGGKTSTVSDHGDFSFAPQRDVYHHHHRHHHFLILLLLLHYHHHDNCSRNGVIIDWLILDIHRWSTSKVL